MQDADLFVAFLRVLDGVCTGSIKELGKTLDLSGAYKQVPVNPRHLWTTGGAVYSPVTESPWYFCQVTLPFGGRASVHSFTRCSRS
eukprot:3446090-Amphidinium_carterae.3